MWRGVMFPIARRARPVCANVTRGGQRQTGACALKMWRGIMFLITYSEYAHKVTHIWKICGYMFILIERCGKDPDFSLSHIAWFLFFERMCVFYLFHDMWSLFEHTLLNIRKVCSYAMLDTCLVTRDTYNERPLSYRHCSICRYSESL